jgi:outer membrane protein assembly factor BamD
MGRSERSVSRALAFRAVIGLVPVGLVSLAGCDLQESKTPLNYTADAKRSYDAAMVEFDDKNWLEAQALLREVRRKYSYSRYAKLAELRLADIDFEQDKFAEAVRQYRQFVHDHRADQAEVVYARSRIAEAEYRQISDSLLLPTADERDQGVVMDAYREVKGFVADYPEAKETEKIRELLTDVTARLVRHELYVARFYLNRGNFEAAVGRILYALRNFGGAEGDETEVPQDPEHEGEVPRGRGARGVRDVEARGGTSRTAPPKVAADTKLTLRRTAGHVGSGLEPEALLLLGETYLKMKKPPEAKEAFEAIVRDYPQSPIVEQAKNYLGFIGTGGGATKGAQGG